jgi:hypothetical protein
MNKTLQSSGKKKWLENEKNVIGKSERLPRGPDDLNFDIKR